MAIRIKIGDVFSVGIGNSQKKYFQYIADDQSLLNSYVIRAFERAYPEGESPDCKQVVRDEVTFYAHVFLRNGLKLKYWEKIGNAPEIGSLNHIAFRGSYDYGNPKVKVSYDWYIWKINQPFIVVGKLEGKNQEAEIGSVIAPNSIVHRMKTGRYDFVYPGF